jgi:hypothetical protein
VKDPEVWEPLYVGVSQGHTGVDSESVLSVCCLWYDPYNSLPLHHPSIKNNRTSFMPDGIIDLQEEHDENISNQICIHTSFLDDDISSTMRIIIPNELIKKFKKIAKHDPIKISCSLAYTQNQNTLFLTAQSVHPINSIDIILE